MLRTLANQWDSSGAEGWKEVGYGTACSFSNHGFLSRKRPVTFFMGGKEQIPVPQDSAPSVTTSKSHDVLPRTMKWSLPPLSVHFSPAFSLNHATSFTPCVSVCSCFTQYKVNRSDVKRKQKEYYDEQKQQSSVGMAQEGNQGMHTQIG